MASKYLYERVERLESQVQELIKLLEKSDERHFGLMARLRDEFEGEIISIDHPLLGKVTRPSVNGSVQAIAEHLGLQLDLRPEEPAQVVVRVVKKTPVKRPKK